MDKVNKSIQKINTKLTKSIEKSDKLGKQLIKAIFEKDNIIEDIVSVLEKHIFENPKDKEIFTKMIDYYRQEQESLREEYQMFHES